MSISQEELKKISEKLSKIPSTNEALLGNISDILEYMELLNEVDTSNVIPTISVIQNNAHLREDVLHTGFQISQELINCSHQKTVAGNIVLPNIMK